MLEYISKFQKKYVEFSKEVTMLEDRIMKIEDPHLKPAIDDYHRNHIGNNIIGWVLLEKQLAFYRFLHLAEICKKYRIFEYEEYSDIFLLYRKLENKIINMGSDINNLLIFDYELEYERKDVHEIQLEKFARILTKEGGAIKKDKKGYYLFFKGDGKNKIRPRFDHPAEVADHAGFPTYWGKTPDISASDFLKKLKEKMEK